MTPFTQTDRQAGRKAMESSLTPMQKALRKFGAGRPPAAPKSSPLAVVSFASEQRSRLGDILMNEPGLDSPRITSAAVVVRALASGPGADPATVLITEGKESEAVATLEIARGGVSVIGLMFGVREGGKTLPVAFPIDRTPSGMDAMRRSFERQTSGAVRKSIS